MKQDITQLLGVDIRVFFGCGLVMKQDITQPSPSSARDYPCCGLVMKQDITQGKGARTLVQRVVIW